MRNSELKIPPMTTTPRLAGVLETTLADLLQPWRPSIPPDDELARRAQAPDGDFIDARVLLAAIDEAEGSQRYSRRGRRPAVARRLRQLQRGICGATASGIGDFARRLRS